MQKGATHGQPLDWRFLATERLGHTGLDWNPGWMGQQAGGKLGATVMVLNDLEPTIRQEVLNLTQGVAIHDWTKRLELVVNLAHRFRLFGFDRSPDVRKLKGLLKATARRDDPADRV